VPAHHAHQPGAGEVPVGEGFLEGVAHGMVVQGSGEGGVQAAALPGQDAPLVDPGIRRGLVLLAGDPCVQLVRYVQAAAVRIERDAAQLGEDQRAAVAQAVLHAVVEGAPQENGAAGVHRGEFAAAATQVQGLRVPAVHGPGTGGDQPVEMCHALDVEGAGARVQGGVRPGVGRSHFSSLGTLACAP
jgi:hypothetical protein